MSEYTGTNAPNSDDSLSNSLMKIARSLYLALGGGTSLVTVSGFSIPSYDYAVFTYVGITNNALKAIYKTGGASGNVVATLDFTYIASGAADDDDIATITKS